MGRKKDKDKDVEKGTAEETLEPSEAAKLRLGWILEMKAEGLSDDVIATMLNIDAPSVRNIHAKYIAEVNWREHVFNSSIALSLMHHTPTEEQIDKIKKLRAAADMLAQLIDYYGRHNERAQCIALKNLEDTLMWAVKAVVVPAR